MFSPIDSLVYAEYLFNVGLVGESKRNELIEKEKCIKSLIKKEDWRAAEKVRKKIKDHD